MAKGSQLTQLKTALADAGVSRKSQSSSKKRKRDASEARKSAEKIKEINEKLNPFDVKVTKLKHDVGGRKVKGKEGRPALKNQAGIEQRKKSLLKEIGHRHRTGSIVDRRFGENDPSMTPEERMLERFVKERQRTSKSAAFNLDDEDELTHYGQSLSNVDDFDGIGLGNSDDDEGLDVRGRIDAETVSRDHFGGFDDDDDEERDANEPSRKKTKAEVMSEVIAKSKEHKYLRQLEREKEDNVRRELDEGFDDIRALLLQGGSSNERQEAPPIPKASGTDSSYDRIVRELAFESRAKPKDRTKTEEELAAEAKEKLEKAERQRLRRMQGLDEESDEDDKSRRKKRKLQAPSGDDLDDDFMADADVLDGLGSGLQEDGEQAEPGDSDEDDDDDDDDDEDEGSSDVSSQNGEGASSLSDPGLGSKAHAKDEGLPFVFPCPDSHEDWLEIVQDIDDANVGTVVERILALYHPSLGEGNKEKLQVFNEVLIDHVLHVTSADEAQFVVVETLTPYIFRLSRDYPDSAAEAFVEKLMLMEKNLTKGVAKGPLTASSKTFPGLSELTLLRLAGLIWSTSDMKHRVIGPARMLMGAYLELGRIRSLQDIASGLFVCSLWMQYESLSNRLTPECVNFLLTSLLVLVPTSYTRAFDLPFTVFALDFASLSGRLTVSASSKMLVPGKPRLASLVQGTQEASEQAKVDLISLTLKLLAQGAELHKSLPGFIEMYEPAVEILSSVRQKGLSPTLSTECQKILDTLSRLVKFATLSRKPLLLQEHKPMAIATYAPKFGRGSSSFLHAKDPDHERAAATKLRREYKQEKKGAMKELRKDARFLAQHQQEAQAEKDKAYQTSMRRAMGSIEGERAEEKRALKVKVRDRKRSGKK